MINEFVGNPHGAAVESRRPMFEKWWHSAHGTNAGQYHQGSHGGCYQDPEVDAAWSGWNAGLNGYAVEEYRPVPTPPPDPVAEAAARTDALYAAWEKAAGEAFRGADQSVAAGVLAGIATAKAAHQEIRARYDALRAELRASDGRASS